jgi:hypothetical protein
MMYAPDMNSFKLPTAGGANDGRPGRFSRDGTGLLVNKVEIFSPVRKE